MRKIQQSKRKIPCQAVLYFCGIPAPMKTSWKNDNPITRFYDCASMSNGSEFFAWEDPSMCTREIK